MGAVPKIWARPFFSEFVKLPARRQSEEKGSEEEAKKKASNKVFFRGLGYGV